MASIERVELYNASITGVLANDKGTAVSTEALQTDFTFFINLSNRTAGNYTGIVEHSPDGTNWVTLVTFTVLGANGVEQKTASVPVLGYLRADVSASAGNGDLVITAHWDRKK